MSLLARYESGEHQEVYAELLRARVHPDADAVASVIMKRVRANLEVLVERWRARGFKLAAPMGTPNAVALGAIETIGSLPRTLAAFYAELGEVNFVAQPPDDEWPSVEELDPIQVVGLASDVQDEQLRLFDDPLIKFNIGGVGSVTVLLDEPAFDAVLLFEGEPWRPDGEDLTFVTYLRQTILERGGIGIAGGADISRGLRKALTAGLTPF